jgi:hypothetical protein
LQSAWRTLPASIHQTGSLVMPRQPRLNRSIPACATAAGLALVGLAIVADATPAAAGERIVVYPNESIQAALDNAGPNSTIVVAGGVHAEQVTIANDGVTLVGDHTKLVPPPTPVSNPCSGVAGPEGDEAHPGPPTQAGICVIGHDVVLGPFDGYLGHTPVVSLGRPIRNVKVEGFEIEGFTGPYVAVVGGRDARVTGTQLEDPVKFGVLSVGSRSTRVTRNEIDGALGFIGVCVEDVASPVVDRNDIAGMVIGVCVETTGASVTHNEVHDNCIGISVDPGIGATITHNVIADNNACPDLESSGRGVTLSGTHGTVVSHNVFRGHSVGGLPALLVTDDENTGSVATGNVVTHNQFADNTLDIELTASGDNRIAHNDCDRSIPAELCD